MLSTTHGWIGDEPGNLACHHSICNRNGLHLQEVSMKQEKQDYLNGYELSKLHDFIKANGDMHEHGSVPKHLSYWAEKGYIAGIDEREFKRDLILYF
jgi:hypothetical protein